jgi:hypothetical protein
MARGTPSLRRFLRYLVSAKNLLGLLGAFAGLVLHWFGLFGPFWPTVVVGLYAVGALLGPAPKPKVAGDVFDARAVRQSLDHAYQSTHGRLPADVQSQVAHIRQVILELVPHTAEFPPGSRDLFVLQRTAVDYLPTTIEAYLALPPAYGSQRVVQDGKTPLEVLKEQLGLLDQQMEEVAEAVHLRDTDKLLAQGIFLEERFGQRDGTLRLPPET